MWLYLDYRGCVMAYNCGSMDGNTDWVYYGGELSGEITDDHGAALYRLLDGELIERSEEERMKDWLPEPEPEATADDYREMLRELGVNV